MRIKKETALMFTLVTLIILLLNTTSSVRGIPPVAAEFHGWAIIDGEFAPKGTIISIYDSEDTICGEIAVREKGGYGLLSCAGDDPSTEIDEGASDNEGLMFYVGETRINTQNSVYWKSGTIRTVNLIVGDVNSAKPILEEPGYGAIFRQNYLVFLLVFLFIAVLILASVIRKVWKGVNKIKDEKEDFNLDEL